MSIQNQEEAMTDKELLNALSDLLNSDDPNRALAEAVADACKRGDEFVRNQKGKEKGK